MTSENDAVMLQVQDILTRPTAAAEKRLQTIAMLDPALIDRVINLAKKTRAMIIDHTWPNSDMRSEIDELVQVLRDEATSVLELLIIETVVTAFVRLCGVEQYYTVATFSKPIPRSMATYWDKTLSEAQKRFLRSVETLAKVRRLAVKIPQLQFNMANQQVVNVMPKARQD